MKNLRNYLLAIPSILLIVVIFLWFQASQPSDALILDPFLLGEIQGGEVEGGEVYEEEIEEGEEAASKQMIYVDLKGAVRYPNVYSLPIGSRLFDVIELAGGLLPNAATQQLNQSLLLSDQLLIYIYSLEEITSEKAEEPLAEYEMPIMSSPEMEASNDLVNINQATEVELMTLPGIGPKKAEAIIQFRTDHGAFESPEAIMEVSGIGQKTYEQLSPYIRVD